MRLEVKRSSSSLKAGSLGKALWNHCCAGKSESFQRRSPDLGLEASVNISLFKEFHGMEP